MDNTFYRTFAFYLALSLFLAVFTVQRVAAQLTQYRVYECSTKSSSIDCKLRFFDDQGEEEWNAISDSGCFLEYSAIRGKVIEYCPLQCPEADEASIIHLKSSNLDCMESSSVEQRATDWFLLRSGDCIKQQIKYRLRCTYHDLKKEKKIDFAQADNPSGGMEMKPEFQIPEEEMLALAKMEEQIKLSASEEEEAERELREDDRKNVVNPAETSEILRDNRVEEEKRPSINQDKLEEHRKINENEAQVEVESSEDEDDDKLPVQVDALLSAMFPSYRRAKAKI